MKPSVKVENVRENEDDSDVTRDTLPSVPEVAPEAILLRVGSSGLGDPNADDGMEQNRAEDKRPFDERQKRDGVNREDVILEDRSSRQKASVGQQVHAHVSPHRNQTT